MPRTEEKSSAGTANKRTTQATRGDILLYHALVVRLSPISPTETSLHGWWIPRRQKEKKPAIGPTNNRRVELIECVSETS